MNLWRRMTEQNPNLSKGSCMSRTYVSRWEFARFSPHGCADMGIWMCTHAHTYFTHVCTYAPILFSFMGLLHCNL